MRLPRLRFAPLLALLAFAPACGETPPPKKPGGAEIDPAEQKKFDEGRKKIDQANVAIGSKAYKKARKYLNEAQALGIESQRFEIEEALEKIDKHEAKAFAKEAAQKLGNKDCAGAFAELAAKMKERESEAFTRELRTVTKEDAVKCMQAFVDDAVLGLKYADARKLVESDDTKEVLGAPAQKKAREELQTTIEESLRAQLDGDVKGKKWPNALSKIEAWVKKGDADDSQAANLLTTVRTAVAPELAKQASSGVGARDATTTLKSIDATVKLMKWDPNIAADVAAIDKDKAMPDDLGKKYKALSTWVEGTRIKLKPSKRAEKRWTVGKVAVFQPAKADADAKRDLSHASEVWVIGVAKDKALIAEKDPGDVKLAIALEGVLGWVATDRLANENSSDWLVPDDQLKGERVWGPLRPPDASYELGTVTEVSGKDISVKRLADDQIVKMTRQKLRSGRLSPGTKVLTFCTAKDQPAKILEVLPTGSAKLKCDSGEEKEEVLPSLRSKADLLPPSK